MVKKSCSLYEVLCFSFGIIKKASLQLFISAILIALYLGFLHGIVAKYLSNVDFQAYGNADVSFKILMVETIGLFAFYTTLYPFLKGYILKIGLGQIGDNRMPSFQHYFKEYSNKYKRLVVISWQRFGYQTISLVCLLILTWLNLLWNIYFYKPTISGIDYVLIGELACLFFIAGIPAFIGYKKFIFSEIIVLSKNKSLEEATKEDKQILFSTRIHFLIWKGILSILCFILLLLFTRYISNPSYFYPYDVFTPISLFWPIYSLYTESSFIYITIFALTYSFFFLLETLSTVVYYTSWDKNNR